MRNSKNTALQKSYTSGVLDWYSLSISTPIGENESGVALTKKVRWCRIHGVPLFHFVSHFRLFDTVYCPICVVCCSIDRRQALAAITYVYLQMLVLSHFQRKRRETLS